MMIRYLSDLHLEFIKPHKIHKFIQRILPDLSSICILAGDIGNPYQSNYDHFMRFVNQNFKKTFVIAGNHEYYHKTKTIQETNNYLEEYFKQFDNISFLNNRYEIYNNYCFIGTTMWSHIINPDYEINDTHSIPNFNYIEYNKLNKICVDFLTEALNENNNCIIITHHMPSKSLIDNKYNKPEMAPYHQWFYSNMDSLITSNQHKIKCWIYGHTHSPSNKTIHNIPFICNPIGYPNENKTVDFNTMITIDE